MSIIWKCKHCDDQFTAVEVTDKGKVAFSYTTTGLDQVVEKTSGIRKVMCAECNIFHSKDKKKAS